MGKALTTATFDYGVVDKDTKGKLIYLAGQFSKAINQHAAAGMEAGRIISEAHAILAKAGKDGEFSSFVECELKVSRQTAYNYKWAWDRFGNCKTVLQFDAAAMYKLAAPTVPEAAAKEAIKLAEKGQRIDKDKAKELVEKFRAAVARSKPTQSSNGAPAAASNGSPPEPPKSECEQNAGGHEWESDESGSWCKHCKEDGPKPAEPWTPPEGVKQYNDSPEPPEETPVGKLFSKLLTTMGQVVRLCDEIKAVAPDKLYDDVFASLDCANKDIHKWRDSAKRRAKK